MEGKNEHYIENRKGKFIPYNFAASTAAISLGVAEEFVILSIVTIVSYLLNNYIVWFGLFIAFAIHLFFHFAICISLRKYVPGVTTSIIFIPICCYLIYRFNISLNYTLTASLLSILLSTLIMIVNIYAMHKAVEKFSSWLVKYKIRSL